MRAGRLGRDYRGGRCVGVSAMTAGQYGERTLRICDLWKRGCDAHQIAEIFGVQRPAVYKALRRGGLLPPYRHGERRKSPPRPELPQSEPNFTTRDPCPRCGIRRDLGCNHRPIERLASC